MRKLLIFLLGMLATLPLVAGPGDQGPPPELVLKEVLQLSDAQIGAIQQLAQARQQAVQAVAQQIQAKQQALYELLEQPTPDPVAAGTLVVAIRDLQHQIAQKEQDYAQGFLALLTDTQRSQVQHIKATEAALRAAGALHALGL